jgi:GH24 family phage-related lysozyme (muramidase)
MDSPIKNNKEFIFNLIQRGKEAGMIWNGVAWVPAGADGKPSKVSKGPKITEVSRVSKKTSPSSTDNVPKSFTKIFESIGNEISSMKNTLNAFVKGQEKLKKKADEEKLKEKNEAYAAKYKKGPVKKDPEKISEEPKKSFFEFLKDLFKSILKFFAVGIGLIALSKFFNVADVKETIKNLIVKILATISGLIVKGSELIHEILKPGETSNKIIGFIEKVIYSVIQVISDFIGFIKNFVQRIATDDKLLGNVQSIIENIVITLFTVIKATVESLKGVFQKVGPELTEGIIKGITFVLEGIASGVQFLTQLVNDPSFRQGFADVFQAMYDLIASIFDIEVPVPVFGTVKLGTIITIVVGTMAALDLAMKALIGYLIVKGAKAGMKSGIRAATGVAGTLKGGKGGSVAQTGCSDVLGGPGKTGKKGRFFDALGGSLGVLQVGGTLLGAGTAAYAFSETSERGDELRNRYGTMSDDEKLSPSAGVPTTDFTPKYTPSSTSTPSTTPTSTSASAAVPSPAQTTTSSSPSSPTSARPVNQSPAGMPKTLEEYVSMEFERKKAREGFRTTTYASPEGGTDTVGIGHKLSKKEQEAGGVFIGGRLVKVDRTTPMSEQQVKDLYIQDIMNHANGAKNQINKLAGQDVWSGLNPMQQYALMDLSFAGGPGLITKDLADAIKSGDMNRAAQLIQQKARTYRKNGVTVESAHHAKHADLRADIFRGYDPLLTGGTSTTVASYTPKAQQSMSTPASSGASLSNSGQTSGGENPFSFIEKLLPTEPNSVAGSGGMMENVVSKSLATTPSMASANKNMAEFLGSASEELKKLMQDNDLLGIFFKDQVAKADSKVPEIVSSSKTSTNVNPEVNSGIGSVYDEEFVKKVFG